MRILVILAVVVGAIWAAKTGKLKKNKLDGLKGRASDLVSNATDDLGKRAEGAADRVKSHAH
jgi:uncharacterized protein YjbJ (UPF0337 family)